MEQETKIPNRSNWDFGYSSNNAFTKESLQQLYIKKTLLKTQKMFEYSGLPESIPQEDLELIIQIYGYAVITEVNGKLYALRGGLGGKPNPYYRPTIATVANPALNFSGNLKIGEECIVIRNDELYMGLMPEIEHSAYLLAEADISFKFACINMRIPALITAHDDATKESAEEFFKQIENGTSLGVILDDDYEDKLDAYDYTNKATNVTHLIELRQYIMGTFYQELGIQSQFNMKREAINEAEAALSQDVLFPTVDNMLMERKKGIEEVNKKYGTNISVKLSSIWSNLREVKELTIDQQKAEIDALEQPEVSNEDSKQSD